MPIPIIWGEYIVNNGNPSDKLYFHGQKFGVEREYDNLKVGLTGNLRFGRDSNDDLLLNGLKDIDTTFEVGPTVEYALTEHLDINAEMLADVGGVHKGFTIAFGGNYDIPLSRYNVSPAKW